MKRILAESIEEIAYSVLQKNHSIDRDQFSITVKRVDKRTLVQPTITINGPPRVTISAAEAELQTDWKNHACGLFIATAWWISRTGKYTATFPARRNMTCPIDDTEAADRYHRDYVALGNVPSLVAELQTTSGNWNACASEQGPGRAGIARRRRPDHRP